MIRSLWCGSENRNKQYCKKFELCKADAGSGRDCIEVRFPSCNLFSLVSDPYDPCSVEDGLEDVIYGHVGGAFDFSRRLIRKLIYHYCVLRFPGPSVFLLMFVRNWKNGLLL
jgi:hypothetical protein